MRHKNCEMTEKSESIEEEDAKNLGYYLAVDDEGQKRNRHGWNWRKIGIEGLLGGQIRMLRSSLRRINRDASPAQCRGGMPRKLAVELSYLTQAWPVVNSQKCTTTTSITNFWITSLKQFNYSCNEETLNTFQISLKPWRSGFEIPSQILPTLHGLLARRKSDLCCCLRYYELPLLLNSLSFVQ